MEFRLEKLGPTFKKQIQPACACCGYDAEWILQIMGEDTNRIERMFCEHDMRDALLDAMNFNTAFDIPDVIEAA